MKKIVLLFFTLLLVLPGMEGWAQESTLVEIAGHVTDQETKDPLPGVSVYVKGTVTGTATNNDGDFCSAPGSGSRSRWYSRRWAFQQQEFEVKSPRLPPQRVAGYANRAGARK
jgi:hypothetical protein